MIFPNRSGVVKHLRQEAAEIARGFRRLADPRISGVLLGIEILVLYSLYGWHPFVIQTYAMVDDGLYVRQATGFLNWLSGKSQSWLGGYDCFLLSKVPLYGLWLAFLHLLGIPLRVGDFLLLLAGAVLFRRAVRPVRQLRPWEFAVVLLLFLANPFINMDFFLRRLTLHIALTNLCLTAAIGLALRAQAATTRRARWAVLTGLAFGLCYLNREETVWLLAALLATFAILWLASFLAWRRAETTGRRAVVGQAGIVLGLVAGALLPILTVCTLNQRSYGVFLVSFRNSPALTGLVQRLTSLEPAGHQAYIPITRATRLRAYELSPSFAKLKPYLEGSAGYWHAGNAEHAAMNGHRPEEGEVFTSYFEFCLYWAAQEAGAKHARQMAELFRAIDRELAQAVREHKIAAGRSGLATLSVPLAGDYRRMVVAFGRALASLVFVGTGGYAWPPDWSSMGSRAQRTVAGNLTHSWVLPEPVPNLTYSLREPVVRRIKQVQTVAFPLCLCAMVALLVWRRKQAFTMVPSARGILLWSFAVPASGLAAFCAAMAIVEVTGFKFLATMGYAVLGYSPLTVLCALVFVGGLVWAKADAHGAGDEPGSPAG